MRRHSWPLDAPITLNEFFDSSSRRKSKTALLSSTTKIVAIGRFLEVSLTLLIAECFPSLFLVQPSLRICAAAGEISKGVSGGLAFSTPPVFEVWGRLRSLATNVVRFKPNIFAAALLL